MEWRQYIAFPWAQYSMLCGSFVILSVVKEHEGLRKSPVDRFSIEVTHFGFVLISVIARERSDRGDLHHDLIRLFAQNRWVSGVSQA